MTNLQVALPSTFDNPRQQRFSLPWPIMKFILKNPTAKSWKKLILTCKYFFAKYHVFPVKELTTYDRWDADGKEFDLTKTIPKLWLCDSLKFQFGPMTVADIIPKVFKCNLRTLHVYRQAFTWENYQILLSSGTAREISFLYCSFKYSDGKDVTMDKLLENLHELKDLHIACKSGSKMFEGGIVQKMAKILSGFKYIHSFELTNLDETFDLASFMDFLMKNETIDIDLYYAKDLQFPEAYEQTLENCFEKLAANPPKKRPDIWIPGFDNDQYWRYKKVQRFL